MNGLNTSPGNGPRSPLVLPERRPSVSLSTPLLMTIGIAVTGILAKTGWNIVKYLGRPHPPSSSQPPDHPSPPRPTEKTPKEILLAFMVKQTHDPKKQELLLGQKAWMLRSAFPVMASDLSDRMAEQQEFTERFNHQSLGVGSTDHGFSFDCSDPKDGEYFTRHLNPELLGKICLDSKGHFQISGKFEVQGNEFSMELNSTGNASIKVETESRKGQVKLNFPH